MPIPLVVGPNMNIHEDQHHHSKLQCHVQAYYYVDTNCNHTPFFGVGLVWVCALVCFLYFLSDSQPDSK